MAQDQRDASEFLPETVVQVRADPALRALHDVDQVEVAVQAGFARGFEATEMAVLHERIDTMERIGAATGVMLREELARYQPDEQARQEREAWRQRFPGRLFHLYREHLDDRLGQEDEAQHQRFLKDIS